MEGKIYYVTKAKLKELEKEHAELVALEHNKNMGEEAPKMLESEDMNPEFVSFQEDMGNLRGRIDELKEIIERHEIIKAPPKEKCELVDMGAKVQVDLNGKQNEFMIVGTLEADPNLGRISNESPVGKALLGRKVGDAVTISSPTKQVYKIKNISYEIS